MLRHKSIAALVIGALVHVAAFSDPAFAMSAAEKRGEQVRTAIMKMEVGRDTLVSLKLRNGKTVVGYLTAVSDRSFLVTNPETLVSTQVPYRHVKRISSISNDAKSVIIDVTFFTAIVLLSVACWHSSGWCPMFD